MDEFEDWIEGEMGTEDSGLSGDKGERDFPFLSEGEIEALYAEAPNNDLGMDNEEYLYRVMNPEDPWYMGPTPDDNTDTVVTADTDETPPESYGQRVAEWRQEQIVKVVDAFDDAMDDPADDVSRHFDDIDYDPFPER